MDTKPVVPEPKPEPPLVIPVEPDDDPTVPEPEDPPPLNDRGGLWLAPESE